MGKNPVRIGVDPSFDAWVRELSESMDKNFREVTESMAKNKFRINDILRNDEL